MGDVAKKPAKPVEPQAEEPQRGRPTKLTDALSKALCQDAHDGLTKEGIAYHNGIAPSTLYDCLEKGEQADPDTDLGRFFGDFKKAEAEAELESTKRMREGGPGWQGPATWLERRRPADYRRTERVENTHASPSGGPVQTIDLSDKTADELIAIIKACDGGDGGDAG